MKVIKEQILVSQKMNS